MDFLEVITKKLEKERKEKSERGRLGWKRVFKKFIKTTFSTGAVIKL